MIRLILLLFFFPVFYALCPSNSVPWQPLKTCYFFMTTPKEFFDAENSCKSLNGHLASIHDAFTNAFIQNQAVSQFSDSPFSNVWIGAQCNSGNCAWTDGRPFNFSEFSNLNKNGCGILSLIDGTWDLYDCFDEKLYICETAESFEPTTSTTIPTTTLKPTTTSTSSQPPTLCPSDDWYYLNETNSCYYWTDSYDWATAEEFCVNQSSHLASIHSYTELAFLKNIYNGDLWIGLYAEQGPVQLNTIWQWTDGSNYDYFNWNGRYWVPSMGSNYLCVNAQSTGFLNADCKKSYYGLCKKPSSTSSSSTVSPSIQKCKIGWTYYGGSCYWGPTAASTQSLAEKFCISKGGQLTSIHSKDEFAFLSYATSYAWFWTGLYATNNPVKLNSTWKWSDNSAVNFLPWENGIPSLDNSLCVIAGSDYTVVNRTKIYSYWFQNKNCLSNYTGVCKDLPLDYISTTSPVSPTTPRTPNPCDNVLSLSGNYFIPLAKVNVTTAEEYCEFCGGHLASFHSEVELRTLANNIYPNTLFYKKTSNLWIGLYSDNDGRTWKWNDGSPFDYIKWYPNNPIRGKVDCGNLQIDASEYYYASQPGRYGMANNQNCNYGLYGICKINT